MHDPADRSSLPKDLPGMEIANTPDQGDKTYSYELDPEDRIVFCSDSWDSFAAENDGSHLVFDRIRGQSIWNHIACGRTAELYKRIFASARAGKPVQFFLRCDSSNVRRLLHVSVSPTIDGHVRTTTLLFRADERDPLPTVVREDGPVEEDCYTLCTWCNKLDADGWRELEDVAGLRDADGNAVPLPVRCGVCPTCYERIDHLVSP